MSAVAARDVPRGNTDIIVRQIPVADVEIGANVRVDPGELEGLAASIRELGVLQPVKAIAHPGGKYRLVWGQRRLLASRIAGLETIPAILVDAGDVDAPGSRRAIEQLVENLDRRDLNPIEEAHALREVLDADPRLTQVALAERLGRSPSWLANSLRLLGLDEGVQERVRVGEVSAAHGKAIAALPAAQQREIATRIVRDKISSNTIEAEIKWKRQQADQEVATAKRLEKLGPKAIGALEAAAVPKSAPIYVAVGAGGAGHLREMLNKAGWQSADTIYLRGRPADGGCDCVAFVLEVGRSIEIKPACNDDRHRDRAANARHVADKADREEAARKAQALGKAVEAALLAAPPHRAVLRVIAVSLVGNSWPRPEWSEYAALEPKDLITQIANAVSGYRSRDLDVDAALAELTTDPPTVQDEAAERVKAKRAARVAAMDEIVTAGVPIAAGEVNDALDAAAADVPIKARATAAAAADAPTCSCGKPKVGAGVNRWACTNPDHKP